VLVAHEGHEQPIEQGILPHDHLVCFTPDSGKHFALPLHSFADLFYVYCHRLVSLFWSETL
jgi:hypothetical protein